MIPFTKGAVDAGEYLAPRAAKDQRRKRPHRATTINLRLRIIKNEPTDSPAIPNTIHDGSGTDDSVATTTACDVMPPCVTDARKAICPASFLAIFLFPSGAPAKLLKLNPAPRSPPNGITSPFCVNIA